MSAIVITIATNFTGQLLSKSSDDGSLAHTINKDDYMALMLRLRFILLAVLVVVKIVVFFFNVSVF